MSDWKSRAKPITSSWKDRAAPVDYEAEATLAAEKKYEETKPDMLESAKLGLYQGLTRNFGDELAGKVGSFLGRDENTVKANIQDRIKRSKEEQGAVYLGGEIASKIATLPATSSPIAAGVIAAADTAASGIGDDKSAERVALETAGSGLTAGLLTKFLPMLTKAGSEKLAQLLQSRADTQAVKALGGTQGQIQKLGDKLPEIAQYSREKVLTPFGSSASIAEKATGAVDDLAQQTKPIYEAAKDATTSADDIIAKIDSKISELKGNPGNMPIVNKLEAYKSDILEAGAKEFNPSDLRAFRQSVDKTVNFQSDAPAQLAKQDMRWLLRDAEMGQIEKIDPALRQANEKLFKDIHLGSLVEDMAEKGAARSAANNDIGLNTWQAMNVAADLGSGGIKTVVVGALREGLRRFGPQLQGIYLDKAAKAMQNPKFASILENAAKRGPEATVAALAAIDKMIDE